MRGGIQSNPAGFAVISVILHVFGVFYIGENLSEPDFDLDQFLLDASQLLDYRHPAKEGCIVISVG